MARRSVYLGQLDINIVGELDLRSMHRAASPLEVARYLFAYGLIADEVCMQGSAPLKSTSVFLAYIKLQEAFQRNELHDEQPIYSFILSNEAESYLGYLVERLSFLRGKGGPIAERNAYLVNNGLDAAKNLDNMLDPKYIKKRTRSVSQEYKTSLLITLKSGLYTDHGISDEVATRAIQVLTNEEIIQTHHLLNCLRLRDVEQINALYRTARDRYKSANAYGSLSIDSQAKPHFQWRNIWVYLSILDLDKFLISETSLDSKLLFKLRTSKALKALNELYFECQDQEDIAAFLSIARQLHAGGRLRSLIKQSPGALVAFLFEAANQADIGYKALNKAFEQLAKIYLLDLADEAFARRVYAIYSSLELLKREITEINFSK